MYSDYISAAFYDNTMEVVDRALDELSPHRTPTAAEIVDILSRSQS